MNGTPPDRARFGVFELDLKAGELHKDGQTVLLQEQPLQVLRMLVIRAGELVTRDEIRNKLWPNDTVVEFDHGINTAILKLRQALGDSAEKPTYIQTVARRGYRLRVPVERVASSSGDGLAVEAVSGAQDEATGQIKLASATLIGKTVSHYRVLQVIGGGGMGVVYKAEDLKLGRAVALKFLPEEVGNDPLALERFEREARVVSSLDHPNICAIYEFEEHESRPFMAMQLLEGRTLRDRMAADEGTLPVQELLEIGIQVSDGLQAAHERGIIHRDIKPANIFITVSRQVKILDFGLAKLASATKEIERDALQVGAAIAAGPQAAKTGPDVTLTRLGVAMGTAGYMSPEQVRGEKLDARTDIFSFGLVLYEMATRQRAFTGETAAVVHDAILKQPPTPIHDLNSSVTPKLEQIVSKALEKDRERRYQSVAEVGSDLRNLAESSPVKKIFARRHGGYAGAMAILSSVPLWLWLVAASFIACFVVGAFYLPFELPEDTGISFALGSARVTNVAPGTPAEQAGFKSGDEIIGMDGRAVHNGFEAESVLCNTTFDRSVSVVALRDGKEAHLQLILQRTLLRGWNKQENLGFWVAVAVSLIQLWVGLIVLFKRPRDEIGAAAGIFLSSLGAGGVMFFLPGVGGPWRSLPLVIQWLVFPTVVITSPIGLPVAPMLLFSLFFPKPLLHRRWAWALVAVLAGPMLACAIFVDYLILFSPSGAVGVFPPRFFVVVAIAIWLAFLASIVALTVNYFTLRKVNERRRIRLVVFGLLLFLADVFAGGLFLSWQKTVWLSQLAFTPIVFGIAQIPFTICVAYAVLNQRLFQVRLIVRQSLRYAVARGVLLLPIPILAGILIFDLIAHKSQPVGSLLSTHGWAYALLTVAGVVAHAKRSQWMEALDRRFYRERYDAQHLLRQTVDEIRASSNLADVAPKVVIRLEQALHPEFVAIQMRESSEPRFHSIASAPPGIQPDGLSASSKLMATFRLFAKPLQTSLAESGWLWQQLPAEDTKFLRDTRLDLVVPIAIAPNGREALMVLGPKKSEEPYGSEDRQLLSDIGSALALLLHRPATAALSGF